MNRFPVFRLPYLALQAVIESIDKTDVLKLAMVSRIIYRLIETTRNAVSMKNMSEEVINKLGVLDRLMVARLETVRNSENIRKELEVDVSKQVSLTMKIFYFGGNVVKSMYLRVHFDSTENTNEENQEMRFGILNVPVFIASNDTIHTKFDDVQVVFQCLCHHFLQSLGLKRLFSLRIFPEQANYDLFSRILRIVIDFVKTTSEETDINIFNFGLLTNQDLQDVFNGAKYGKIFIDGRPTSERNPGNFVCESESLFVCDADWLTLEDIMVVKCKRVFLHKTGMTNDLMKKVVMNWMNGLLENLSFFSVELKEDVDYEVILSGLSKRKEDVITDTGKLVRIERKDGKRALFSISNDESKKKVSRMTIC